MPMTKRERTIYEDLFDVASDIEAVDGSRHAAAVVKKGIPFGMGVNQNKTHPMQSKMSNHGSGHIHAELAAINRAAAKLKTNDLRDYTLIVVRSKMDHGHNDFFGYSKPCEGCQKIIDMYNICRVIYSLDEGYRVEETNDY